MKKSFLKLGLIVLFTLTASLAQEKNMEVKSNQIDLEKYHRLKTSNVMFRSMKGRGFNISVVFSEDAQKIFNEFNKKNLSTPSVLGSMVIRSTEKQSEVFRLVIKPDGRHYGKNTVLRDWQQLLSTGFVDEQSGFRITIKKGEYIAFPNIYIPKEIPDNISHLIEVSESRSFK